MKPILTTLSLITVLIHLQAQNAIPLFEKEGLMEIKLETDLDALLKDRGQEVSWHEAMISYRDKENKTNVYQPVSIQARGNFRRNPQHCVFPPIRVKFQKAPKPQGVFAGQKTLKLVTHCRDADLVLREYLVYKLYEQFTPYSLKTRLLKIKYIDTKNLYDPIEEFAFFLEDDDALSKRMEGEGINDRRIPIDSLDRNSVTLVYTFECMIGNSDWDLYLHKNIDLMDMGKDKFPIVIPYDFDWSKIVSAPYTNTSGMDLQEFKPLCREASEIEEVLSLFESKKEAVYGVYKNQPYLKGAPLQDCLSTLDTFYERIKDRKWAHEKFLVGCVKE